ncbi:MAG: methylated-DNA--[protein]-cysteine S-methyltransferase [Candidatus Nanopelagicales bacterium]
MAKLTEGLAASIKSAVKGGLSASKVSATKDEVTPIMKIIGKNFMTLPGIARDLNVARQNAQKLVKLPRDTDVAHVDISSARKVRHIDGVTDAVRAWVDGDVDAILDVPVDQPGGDFQQAAWQAMRRVRGGTTASYAELAHMSGNAKAVRAAGTACALNHVAPFVPCHRIIHTDGTISAYGFGPDLKVLLLEHEGALL